jgi:hypothetical protein
MRKPCHPTDHEETMKLKNLSVCLMLAFVGGHAAAQNMKPGLWEMSTQMKGNGQMGEAMAEAQRELANMPPEQRKMMQDMMAKQGMQMGVGAGGGMTLKLCMTQEMVDRNEIASGQQNDCTHTHSPRTGNTMKFSFVCTKPPSSGEGQVTFTSPDAYSMKMTTTTTMNGAKEQMEIHNSARWLRSDCGNVKPLGMPKR